MPTYSYRCSACAHQFDQFQKFSDDPLTDCPTCGGEVRRVPQPVGVVFKGSGWYVTDSRPRPAESDADSSSAKKSSSSASKSAESPTEKAAATA